MPRNVDARSPLITVCDLLCRKWFDAVNKSDQYRLHPGSNLELPTSDNPFQGERSICTLIISFVHIEGDG